MPIEELDGAIGVPHRAATDVRAGSGADRALAMLVDDHCVPTDEEVRVMQMEGTPETALVIEEFVGVSAPLEGVRLDAAPHLADLEDRLGRLTANRQGAAEPEGERSGRRLLKSQIAIGTEIEDDAVALKQLRHVGEVVLQGDGGEAHAVLDVLWPG